MVQYRQRAEPLLAIDNKPRLLLIVPVQQHSTEVVDMLCVVFFELVQIIQQLVHLE